MCHTTPPRRSPSGSGRLDRRLDCGVDRPVLVVLRDALDEAARFVAEDDEVANEIQESRRLERAADQDFELRLVGDHLATVDRLPWRVVLEARRERAHDRAEPVRGDADCVGGEDRRDVAAVGLHLVPRALERRVLVAGVLEFDEPERQAVHEDDDVGPPGLAASTTVYWLTTTQSLLAGESKSTNQAKRVSDGAGGVPGTRPPRPGSSGDVGANSQRSRSATRAEAQSRPPMRLRRGEASVDPLDRGTKSTDQHHLVPGHPLLPDGTGPEVGSIENVVTDGTKVIEARLLDAHLQSCRSYASPDVSAGISNSQSPRNKVGNELPLKIQGVSGFPAADSGVTREGSRLVQPLPLALFSGPG